MRRSSLWLESGEQFEGLCPEWQQGVFPGEVVFTTGMVGYVETLTDPSYAGQIVVFTYPLIGNYGVPPPSRWESRRIHAAGVVVGSACPHPSHWEMEQSLIDWLAQEKVPLLTQVDTRALTRRLRASGVALGAIGGQQFADPNQTHLVRTVSCREPILYGQGKRRIGAIDCGMKENILRMLLRYPVEVIRLPFDTDLSRIDCDAIFLSNGPGDPALCVETLAHLQNELNGRARPLFGICLGAQILALAAGGTTRKLKFGHRGQNHPVFDAKRERAYLTAQNHGYAIEDKSLPGEWEVTMRSLNDGSVEAIAHREKPLFAVQFHPESHPGPEDTGFLFDQFMQSGWAG
jgi:carbamoyl-phosphate synthase small subunit